MKRIVTAAALLLFVWLLVEQAPAWIFAGVASLGSALAAWECYGLLERAGSRPLRLLGTLGCALTTLAAWGPLSGLGADLPLMASSLGALAAVIALREDPPAMLRDAVATVFPLLFVGLALSYAVALRSAPGEDGRDLPLFLLVCVSCSDIVALYAGTFLGRRRLAPRVSPKKTWEGAAAGIAASALAAWISSLVYYEALGPVHAVVAGLLLGIAGLGGDLAESAVKRAAGAKDSSALLPGHGGVLDRVDSLLFAAPVLYYYWRAFLEVAR